MNLDENNMQVLSGIFTGRSRSDVRDWYRKYFRNQMSCENGMVMLKGGQVGGGGPELVEIDVDGRPYVFKIDHVEGETASVDGRPISVVDLYFMSFVTESAATNCIWLTTSPSTETGYINGLSKRYRCIKTRQTSDAPLILFDGDKQGEILMWALISYCRSYHKVLGITRLELGDIAEWECPDKVSKISASISNMMLGRDPYYMKFGFRPSPSASKKIAFNVEYAKSETITGRRFTSVASSLGIAIPTDVASLIKSVRVHRLIPLLEAIITLDCAYYSKIHNGLFGKLDFQPLIGDENRYLLVL
jgi:hypothetical protein